MDRSPKPMTIGQLAEAVGVKRSTIRYYEREELLSPAGRSPHGYRNYNQASVERLRFIRAAQATGFSLDDIKSLLRLRDRDQPPCENVRDLIDTRLEEVERQITDLSEVRRVLHDARQRCKAGEVQQTCAVLDQLNTTAGDAAGPCS